ncbi:MAG: ABC transporter permease [Desulfomonilia bacterium]
MEEVTVRYQEQEELLGGLVSMSGSLWMDTISAIFNFIDKTFVIAEVEIRKLRHDYFELITRSIQPILWLLILGQVFNRMHAIPTGNLSYISYMAPGILAQSVLFVAIFFGIAIIWERDLGVLHKFLVSPTPRAALVLGKALSAGVRGLSQAAIIYIISLLLGIQMNWHIPALAVMFAVVILGSGLFATFSLIVACIVKTRDRFMGIGQILTMPLFFASNALYPISIMPHWLQFFSHINPLTYEVDALRALMVSGAVSAYGVGTDVVILLISITLLVGIGAWMYPKVVI